MMKKGLLILLCFPMIGFGQSFYIEKVVSPKSIPQPILLEIENTISTKLLECKQKETKEKKESTYTIVPVISEANEFLGWKPRKGYIAFYESESETLLLKSESESAMRNIIQGFDNPHFLVFAKIVKEQFTRLLTEIEQMDIPIRSVSVIKEQVNNEDKYEKLLKLGKLKEVGILTEEEFNKEKKKILNDE